MKEIKLGRYLGSGFENDCYAIVDDFGVETGKAVHVLNRRGKLWQHKDFEYLEKCRSLLFHKSSLIVGEDIEVLRDVVLIMRNGKKKHVQTVRVTNLDYDFDDLIIKYTDIKAGGTPILKQIMKVVRDGYFFRTEYELGMDPMGADLVLDVLKGFPKFVLIKICSLFPAGIERSSKFWIGGVEGRARNIHHKDGEFECKDIGMQDLSKNGKLRKLMLHYNSFVFAGLIELVKIINADFERNGKNFVPWEDIAALPCKANFFHKFISKTLMKMMLCLFELHDETRKEATNSVRCPEGALF